MILQSTFVSHTTTNGTLHDDPYGFQRGFRVYLARFNSLNICQIERHFNETSIYQRSPHFMSNIGVCRKSEYFRATESKVRSEHTLQNFYPVYPLQTIVNNFSKLVHTQLLYKLSEFGLRLLMQHNTVDIWVGGQMGKFMNGQMNTCLPNDTASHPRRQ